MTSGAASNAPVLPEHSAALRIIHCVRSPVGGIFRHIVDLAEAQSRAGHQVGLICDSSTGGPFEDAAIERARPFFALGVQRLAMRREIAPSDIAMIWRLRRTIAALNPDVLHAHGSKGGAYARTIGTLLRAFGSSVARIYTPHGGSMHYDPGSMSGRVYFAVERLLARMTDAFIFVSQYEEDAFFAKVGPTRKPTAIALNGLRAEEFELVSPATDARDFLFIGMLRDMKGPDVLLTALAQVRDRTGRAPSAFIVGDGPDKARYLEMTRALKLGEAVTFHDPMPARLAFRLAKTMVVPSRNESMPYVVLEGIAAGLPLIATNVGGIPEIFGAQAPLLIPPGDAGALANAMLATLSDPPGAKAQAMILRSTVRDRFSIAAMAATVEGVYRQVLVPAR